MSTLIIGSARHDGNGKYAGGKNGDQDGTEVSTQEYYPHSKGWYYIRPLSAIQADALAAAMLEACSNNNIGYDQNDRNLIAYVRKYGSLAKISVKCDTDCSDLVRACVYQATGADPGDFYTGNEVSALSKTGYFEKAQEVVEGKTVLFNGDILVTKTKGHTVIVVSGRPRYQESAKTGWIQAGSTWYYRTAAGVNAHGFKDIRNQDGKTRRYYFDDKGRMLTGWQQIEGKWYFFENSTAQKLEGAMYTSDENGVQDIKVFA